MVKRLIEKTGNMAVLAILLQDGPRDRHP